MARLQQLQHFGRFARPVLVLIGYLLPFALIIHAVTFWGHGIIDSEAMEFVLNYLQKRPLFAQIFDPQINDWGAYQARELSYLFDLIDARIFAALLDRGLLIFVPLSGVIGLVAFSAIYFYGARKVFALNGIMTCMLLSLFLSCIVIQASTPILYRSSKIILAVALITFLFYLFSLLKLPRREATLLKTSFLFAIGVVMALCDRQGFYYLISATLVVATVWAISNRRPSKEEGSYRRVVGANIAAIIVIIIYNRFAAPRIIHALNGYWPDFTYQNLPLAKLLDRTLPAKSFHIFCDQISFFAGNIPFVVLALIVVLAAGVRILTHRPGITFERFTSIMVSFVVLLAMMGLLGAMIARHPAVYSAIDHQYWYYTLTLHVVFLFALSAWLSFAKPLCDPRIKASTYIVIALLVGLNVRVYDKQREIMINSPGWFDNQYAHSRALLTQFKTDPPQREKLLSRSSDLFLDDQPHFLENVELSYLHLTGALQIDPSRKN